MTAAGLVRLCLIGFAIAASLLALDFLKAAAEDALQDYGPAPWRLATGIIVALVVGAAAAVAFHGPRRLIRVFVPDGAALDFGADYVRWKTLVLMLAGGLVALPAIDHFVVAVIDGHVLDTAQAV